MSALNPRVARTSLAIALAFLLVTVVPAAFAGDESGTDLNALKARVTELEAAKLGLERKVAEPQNHLHRMVAEKAGEVRTITDTFPLSGDGQPDPPHLKGIRLPPNATKEQARAYVARILREAAHHRGGFSAHDPEVPFLLKVGSKHADVLMEPLLYDASPNGDMYLIKALDSLVTDAHKELVLGRLHLATGLVDIVVSRGWTEDAAPVLLGVLANHASWKLPYPNLPGEWISAIATLERPESYGDLKAYLYGRDNRYMTWRSIKDLPGLVLDSDVATLWAWAKELDFTFERNSVAAVAAHYGNLDALAALFEDPGNWPQWEAIESVTPCRVRQNQAEKARQWFQENRDRLVFDSETRRYRVKE